MLNLKETKNITVTDFLDYAGKSDENGKNVFGAYLSLRQDEQDREREEYEEKSEKLAKAGMDIGLIAGCGLDEPDIMDHLIRMAENGIDTGRVLSFLRHKDLRDDYLLYVRSGEAEIYCGVPVPAYSCLQDHYSIGKKLSAGYFFAGLKDLDDVSRMLYADQLARCGKALSELDRLREEMPAGRKDTGKWLMRITDAIAPLGYEKLFLESEAVRGLFDYVGCTDPSYYTVSSCEARGDEAEKLGTGRKRQIIDAAADFVCAHKETVRILQKIFLGSDTDPYSFKGLYSLDRYSLEAGLSHMKALEAMLDSGADAGETAELLFEPGVRDNFADMAERADGGDEPELFRKILENRISLAVLDLDEPEKTYSLLRDSYGLSDGQISQMAENEYSQK